MFQSFQIWLGIGRVQGYIQVLIQSRFRVIFFYESYFYSGVLVFFWMQEQEGGRRGKWGDGDKGVRGLWRDNFDFIRFVWLKYL